MIDPGIATIDANSQEYLCYYDRGQRKGNAKIVFIAENSEGEIYKTFVMVKIRKK